jgi:hypothetical protein
MMVTGSDEEGMKRSSRGQKPRYTLLAVYCLGELYVNELRRPGKKREITGFTQTTIHDCVKQFVSIKNPDIIKAAIYDAISHGWASKRKARERGRDLFTPTKSGLALHAILDEILFDVDTLALYLENPSKVGEKIKHMVMVLKFILDGITSQLNLYRILTNADANSPEHQRISNKLDLLKQVKDAVSGFNREVPGNAEAVRLYNIAKYLLEILKKMDVVGTIALCSAADRLINSADPVTWNENVLG